MIGIPAGTQIWIVAGVTDMRRGLVGLSGLVQTALEQNPLSGHVFVFRGRRGDLIKVLWWNGDGLLPFSGLFMSVIYPTINFKGISCFRKSEHGAVAGVILFFYVHRSRSRTVGYGRD